MRFASLSAQPHHDIDPVASLRDWLQAHHRLFVLTGAGISTASGIPDYRGPDGAWKRRAPITYQAFMREPAMRSRYWGRSFVGWPVVAKAQPTRAHNALVELEAQGRLTALVTQNVDGLHTRAGQREVIDLHGRIDQVICLACGERCARAELQPQLAADNPEWNALRAESAPDGDADLDHADFGSFRIPSCRRCGGLLKPDVVFFGENVPRDRVHAAHTALLRADALLVVGSSLMVYSGFRFARLAQEHDLPIAVLTRGITRADALATAKFDLDCDSLAAATQAIKAQAMQQQAVHGQAALRTSPDEEQGDRRAEANHPQ